MPAELHDQAPDHGPEDLNSPRHQQWLQQNGADAVARVESVEDTGYAEPMTPVVVIDLWVTPAAGAPFGTTIPINVPLAAVPKVGDRIKIKYNPAEVMDIGLPPSLMPPDK